MSGGYRLEVRVVAVDWSGAADAASTRRHLWLAEAEAGTGRILRLEAGRTRQELVQHLLELADAAGGDLVVGLDFAFSFPAWWLDAIGVGSGPALWRLGAACGESWLAGCRWPFWGRPGRRRPPLPAHLRRTEQEVAAVVGRTPKSVFQLGGAGAVGTGSVRGMAVLDRLVGAGFGVWPFVAGAPILLEVWPRAHTGRVVTASGEQRRQRLRQLGLPAGAAAASPDAFDASLTAVAMARCAPELRALPPARDAVDALEGRIWLPRGESAGPHASRRLLGVVPGVGA